MLRFRILINHHECHYEGYKQWVYFFWRKDKRNISRNIRLNHQSEGHVAIAFTTEILNYFQRMSQGMSVMHCVNFNRCSSEQQLLKTVRKTVFWNRNNLTILRGEFTFDLMGRILLHSHEYYLELAHFKLGWKKKFQMVKIYILWRVVYTLNVVEDTTCWVETAHCSMGWCWIILWNYLVNDLDISISKLQIDGTHMPAST